MRTRCSPITFATTTATFSRSRRRWRPTGYSIVQSYVPCARVASHGVYWRNAGCRLNGFSIQNSGRKCGQPGGRSDEGLPNQFAGTAQTNGTSAAVGDLGLFPARLCGDNADGPFTPGTKG